VVNLKEMLVFPHAENPTRFIKSNMSSVAGSDPGSGIQCLFDLLDSESGSRIYDRKNPDPRFVIRNKHRGSCFGELRNNLNTVFGKKKYIMYI
jgi:hypothetical protein